MTHLNAFFNPLAFSFRNAMSLFVPFFKRHGLLTIAVLVLFLGLEEWNLHLLKLTAAQGGEGLWIRVAIALNGSMLGIFFAILVPVYMQDQQKTSSLALRLIGQKTLPLTVEGLRMLIPILLGYLLIIPGIYFQLVYSFVFFIVLFDPKYGADPDYDALKASKELTKGVLGPLLLLLLLSFSAELAITLWGGRPSFFTDPLASLLVTGVKVIMYFFFPAMIYGIYIERCNQKRGLS